MFEKLLTLIIIFLIASWIFGGEGNEKSVIVDHSVKTLSTTSIQQKSKSPTGTQSTTSTQQKSESPTSTQSTTSTQQKSKSPTSTQSTTSTQQKSKSPTSTQSNIYYILARKLNVRSQPSTSGQVLTILTKGQIIEVVEIDKSNSWAKISSNFFDNHDSLSEDREYWVYTKYIAQFDNLKSTKSISNNLHEQLNQNAVNSVPEPEMIDIPGGSFRMGCVEGRDCVFLYSHNEKNVHTVTLKPFLLSKYEVTFEQWDPCYHIGACNHLPTDEFWGRGNRPVINVSWDDVQVYIRWLNKKTGKKYRLPSEAEWEYAARAGSVTKYSWGNELGKNNANCDGCGSPWDNQSTAPVGSFKSNAWGLFDMHGNVSEWNQDCIDDYRYATSNGSAREVETCIRSRVIRGGNWYVSKFAQDLRSAARFSSPRDTRSDTIGFRLAMSR